MTITRSNTAPRALQSKLEAGGFHVTEAKGLNLMQRGVAAGHFDELEASAHPGVFAAARGLPALGHGGPQASYGVVTAVIVLGTNSTHV